MTMIMIVVMINKNLRTEYHTQVHACKNYMTWNINIYLIRMSLFTLSQTMGKNGQRIGVYCVKIIPNVTRSYVSLTPNTVT